MHVDFWKASDKIICNVLMEDLVKCEPGDIMVAWIYSGLNSHSILVNGTMTT